MTTWQRLLVYFGLVEDPANPRSEAQERREGTRSSVLFAVWIVVGVVVGSATSADFWTASGIGVISGLAARISTFVSWSPRVVRDT